MATNTCKCPHHKITPVLIILFGLALLGNAMGWLAGGTLYIIVAVLVIILGIKRLTRCSCCADSNSKMPV